MASPTSKKASYPLYRRVDSAERGRHLVAARFLPKGRLILAERPLVALQSLDNQAAVQVCHHCKTFVGGPDYALRRRYPRTDASAEEATTLPSPDDDASFSVVPCRHGCGHVYCSSACETDAWIGFHAYLCTGLCESADDAIVRFKAYAVETNEILLMVAEWWIAQHTCTDEAVRERYRDFTMPCWWDVAVTSSLEEVGGFAAGVEVQNSCRRVCREAADLLNKALVAAAQQQQPAQPSALVPPITVTDIAQWIGACEQNSMGIRQRHPLCRSVIEDADLRQRRHDEIIACLAEAEYIGNDTCCDDESDGEDKEEDGDDDIDKESVPEEAVPDIDVADATNSGGDNEQEVVDEGWDYSIQEIESFLSSLFIDEDNSVRDTATEDDRLRDTVGDDLDYIFTPLDGTTMYATACKMNHSCNPNVIVLYKGRGWGRQHPLTAYCIAYKDIQEGEELTISYIENDDPLEKRQQDLANYGFVCQCTKCEAERSGEMTESDKNPMSDEVNDLFGGDDDVQDEAGNGDETGEEDNIMSLPEKAERLDSAVNHSRFASVPLELQGKLAAYVLQTGKEAVADMLDGSILRLWQHCENGVRHRDFCLSKMVGCDLEDTLYHMLRRESSWPSSTYRSLYWCACLTGALGLAHLGSFLVALQYLDKAMILGMPRKHELLSDFVDYVEEHGRELALGPYVTRRRNVVPTFLNSEDVQLLEAVGLSRPISNPVMEANPDISYDEFKKKFVSKSTPVVLRGVASDWKGVTDWRSLSSFAGSIGHRLVPIELGSMMQGTMQEKVVSFRSFSDDYLAMSSERKCWNLQDALDNVGKVAYMAQHPLLDQIPALRDAVVENPPLCGPDGPSNVYFWLGTGGTRTPLHFDSYDNLFVQLVGAKYLRIYDQSESGKLYVNKSGYGLQGNMSDVDCEKEDFSKHSLAETAKFQEVLLRPGDAIYIPSRTWHYVRSLSTSVSINYWF
jgi:lysine-specific demethylase 8